MADDMLVRSAIFDGDTIEPERDNGRLFAQLKRVKELMSDGRWRTLADISEAVGDPPASVSARLRDLRKKRWGSLTVERRHKSKGLFEYRLVNPFQDEK